MTEQALKFGPVLLLNKNEYFYKKWQHEKDALLKIKSNLNEQQHATRLDEINKEINLINEVL